MRCCWRTSAPVGTIVADVAPRTAAAAGRIEWRRPHWWRWRCPVARRCPTAPVCWWPVRRTVARQGDYAVIRKWGPRGNVELVRLSFGRFGDDIARRVGDDDLLAWAAEDLEDVFGVNIEPFDCRVHRWIDAMPQYGPGHGDLVAELRAGLPPSLAVAGGYLDGIGVPACVRGGHQGGGVPGHTARGTIEAMARLDYDALNSTVAT